MTDGRLRHHNQTASTENPTEGPGEESNAETLLNQADAWTAVARDALSNCEQADEAERELHRRRNDSGQ